MSKKKASSKKISEKKIETTVEKEMDYENKVKRADEKEPEVELKLGFYTGSVLVAVIVAAVNTLLAFILTAKPDYYFIDSKVGAACGENREFYVELFRTLWFDDTQLDKLTMKVYLVAAFATICAIFLIVSTTRITSPSKKPAVLCTLLAFLFSVLALLFIVFARDYAETCLNTASERYDVNLKHTYNIYDYCFISCIANAVFALLAVTGCLFSKKKYNKDGKAY